MCIFLEKHMYHIYIFNIHPEYIFQTFISRSIMDRLRSGRVLIDRNLYIIPKSNFLIDTE